MKFLAIIGGLVVLTVTVLTLVQAGVFDSSVPEESEVSVPAEQGQIVSAGAECVIRGLTASHPSELAFFTDGDETIFHSLPASDGAPAVLVADLGSAYTITNIRIVSDSTRVVCSSSKDGRVFYLIGECGADGTLSATVFDTRYIRAEMHANESVRCSEITVLALINPNEVSSGS